MTRKKYVLTRFKGNWTVLLEASLRIIAMIMLLSALGTVLSWVIIHAVLLFCLIGICLVGFVREQTGNKQIYGELCQLKGYA